MTNEKKYKLYRSVGICIACIPLLVWIIVHFSEYFTTKTSLTMSLGCVMSLILLVLIIKKKADFLKGLYGFIILFLLCFLFNSILDDMEYISGMALIGEMVYTIFFAPKVKKYERLMDKEETARINANALGDILSKEE